MKNNKKISIIVGLVALVVVIAICLPAIVNLFTEGLWYKDLGYYEIFTKRIVQQILICLAVGVFAAIIAYLNLVKADKVCGTAPKSRLVTPGISILVGLFIGTSAKGLWMNFQQFINASNFNIVDPIFNNDLGFYLFKLPFLRDIYQVIASIIVLTLIVVIVKYLKDMAKDVFVKEEVNYEGPINIKRRPSKFSVNLSKVNRKVLSHVGVLIGVLLLIGAVGFVFNIFDLLYSTSGVAYGASYTDVNATLGGLKILIVISALCAISTFITVVRRKVKPFLVTFGVFVLSVILLLSVYPGVVQKFYVEPNELDAQIPYIEHNLNFTRAAYKLDDVTEREFDYTGELNPAELVANSGTVENIRLWDWEPLLVTYSQLQEIRLYYKFNDLDIDRYTINGVDKQLMVAAREMDVDRLPDQAQNWINRHLKYTHGYGVVASPVSEVGPDGLPKFLIQDIPPTGAIELMLDRPEIYFGELTKDYVIVDTNTDEFDYPIGDSNAYNRYEGEGGIKLSNFFTKVAFSIKFGTLKMLLSSDITKDSKVLYDRAIQTRVQKIAPFLTYDEDPYIVTADGRLVWIYDAYTTTNLYPYSHPVIMGGQKMNYIRNSVKVTIDAYTGETKFYISDDTDPIIDVYAKIFPNLFESIENMPASLREHIRYPEDFYLVQTEIYKTYHMKDPSVFYNKEDYWNIPYEIYGNSKTQLAPYYVNMRLPAGDGETEFVLIMPYTPASRDNMVAWMAARCDGDNYGELVLYKFSKQKMIYGPMQVEAQIDQDKEISQMLSLLNQQGSKVLRGNMIVYPMTDSFLFVEPLFIAAERSQLPQLQMVIVSDGSKVTYGDNLDEALSSLFLGRTSTESTVYTVDDRQLSRRALELYERSQASLAVGNWAEYGRTQAELEMILREMVEGEIE